jgi:very-short-patch-repair endonuclease
MRPEKPRSSVKRAKRLRRELTKPELMLWQILRSSPNGHKFRKQHPAGPFVLDFFCARANLAIEADGFAHDTGDRPERDARRDAWLAVRRIDTIRIPAVDVLNDAVEVAGAIVATVEDRLGSFGKAPPSSLRDATSPSQVDGEEMREQ